MQNNKIIRILLFFFVFLILLQVFGGSKDKQTTTTDEVVITSNSKFTINKPVLITVENRSPEAIQIQNPCPKNPFLVEIYKNGEWLKKEAILSDASLCKEIQTDWTRIEPNKNGKMTFGLWNKDLFSETGHYRITLETNLKGKVRSYFREIDIAPPTFLQNAWKNILYRPIFNTLIFFIAYVPGHNLGWAILLLTLLIKLILLVPNQKALKSQRALQVIQPQLDALKEKHKDNPQALAQETMAIWKEHKVSPMGSCLPMLIQFPILIALFYVVKDGLSVFDSSLLYGTLKGFDLKTVNSMFLGLNLTKINLILLPVLIGGLQFVQIRMSFSKAKKQGGSNPSAAMMNNMMQFVLPVMIAIFSAGLPAAVGLYWGVSTLFAIGQQFVVNRSKN